MSRGPGIWGSEAQRICSLLHTSRVWSAFPWALAVRSGCVSWRLRAGAASRRSVTWEARAAPSPLPCPPAPLAPCGPAPASSGAQPLWLWPACLPSSLAGHAPGSEPGLLSQAAQVLSCRVRQASLPGMWRVAHGFGLLFSPPGLSSLHLPRDGLTLRRAEGVFGPGRASMQLHVLSAARGPSAAVSRFSDLEETKALKARAFL